MVGVLVVVPSVVVGALVSALSDELSSVAGGALDWAPVSVAALVSMGAGAALGSAAGAGLGVGWVAATRTTTGGWRSASVAADCADVRPSAVAITTAVAKPDSVATAASASD